MKLSPGTIAANLSAAAIAEAEAAASTGGNNNNNNLGVATTNNNNNLLPNVNINSSNLIGGAGGGGSHHHHPVSTHHQPSAVNVTANTTLASSTATTSQQHQQQQHSSFASATLNPAGMASTSSAATGNVATANSETTPKTTPRDTQTIMAILTEMGIQDYDPRILPQLVEFAYRYSSKVLEDSQLYSYYAKKKVIDTDDVNLALQTQFDRSFVGPPARDVLLEIARSKNAQPLPPIKSHNGLRLPADRFSLVANNVRLQSGSSSSNNKPH